MMGDVLETQSTQIAVKPASLIVVPDKDIRQAITIDIPGADTSARSKILK